MTNISLIAVEVHALLRAVEYFLDDMEVGSEDYRKRNRRLMDSLNQVKDKLLDAASGDILSSKSGG